MTTLIRSNCDHGIQTVYFDEAAKPIGSHRDAALAHHLVNCDKCFELCDKLSDAPDFTGYQFDGDIIDMLDNENGNMYTNAKTVRVYDLLHGPGLVESFMSLHVIVGNKNHSE